MKPRFQNERNRGMTFFEVLVVIAILFYLALMLLPFLARPKRNSIRVNCVRNLNQINLAFRIWEGDNNNKYPMAVSVTNGGAMETTASGDVVNCFLVMSNELSTPKILVCPADAGRVSARNFGKDFNNSHISYFVGVDVTNESNPQMILSGDDNFQMGGAVVPSGLFQFSTNTPIAWTADRHKFAGNIGFADGSVFEVGNSELQADVIQTGLATNRLAIP